MEVQQLYAFYKKQCYITYAVNTEAPAFVPRQIIAHCTANLDGEIQCRPRLKARRQGLLRREERSSCEVEW